MKCQPCNSLSEVKCVHSWKVIPIIRTLHTHTFQTHLPAAATVGPSTTYQSTTPHTSSVSVLLRRETRGGLRVASTVANCNGFHCAHRLTSSSASRKDRESAAQVNITDVCSVPHCRMCSMHPSTFTCMHVHTHARTHTHTPLEGLMWASRHLMAWHFI